MRLAFVGDVMLGRLVNSALQRNPPQYPWGDTLAVLREADLRVCNLECVVSDRGEPWSASPKAFHFRSDAHNIATLQAAQVGVVSLANNHVLDFGYDALNDMLTLLDAAEIRHAGAGHTLEEAMRPAMVRTSEGMVALLAATDNEPLWAANADQAGIWYMPTDITDARAQRLLQAVRDVRPSAKVVVVSLHWGGNWGYTPPFAHSVLAHTLIDSGADIIFGHSGHVLRGVELYHGKPVLYSAGDFIDDYRVDAVERNDESSIFVVEIGTTAASNTVRMYPTVIEHFRAARARGDRADKIARKVRSLCAALGTHASWMPDEGYVEAELGQNAPDRT